MVPPGSRLSPTIQQLVLANVLHFPQGLQLVTRHTSELNESVDDTGLFAQWLQPSNRILFSKSTLVGSTLRRRALMIMKKPLVESQCLGIGDCPRRDDLDS